MVLFDFDIGAEPGADCVAFVPWDAGRDTSMPDTVTPSMSQSLPRDVAELTAEAIDTGLVRARPILSLGGGRGPPYATPIRCSPYDESLSCGSVAEVPHSDTHLTDLLRRDSTDDPRDRGLSTARCSDV